ncbi:hypothetical protein BDZ91DRAFT_711088 [Kalaharituber pfeilii]|nr:hypothetical protein BDZ91DRAFT_711088 [Kalaharituber pfeilii]
MPPSASRPSRLKPNQWRMATLFFRDLTLKVVLIWKSTVTYIIIPKDVGHVHASLLKYILQRRRKKETGLQLQNHSDSCHRLGLWGGCLMVEVNLVMRLGLKKEIGGADNTASIFPSSSSSSLLFYLFIYFSFYFLYILKNYL